MSKGIIASVRGYYILLLCTEDTYLATGKRTDRPNQPS